jgi:hypothetical protein
MLSRGEKKKPWYFPLLKKDGIFHKSGHNIVEKLMEKLEVKNEEKRSGKTHRKTPK